MTGVEAFKCRACVFAVVSLILIVWSIVDVVKLKTWDQTEGQITQLEKGYYKHRMYYGATVTFMLEDADGVTKKYSFESKFHFHDKSQQFETVTVLYSPKYPTQAELRKQVSGEANAMGLLSVFFVVMALISYKCDHAARRYHLDNNITQHTPGDQEVVLTAGRRLPTPLDADYAAMIDAKKEIRKVSSTGEII